MNIKKRRVMSRDHDEIAIYINDELNRREKQCVWRKKHECRWREIDRQIAMEPPDAIGTAPEEDWHSSMQLGDLTDASETMTADTLRMGFPKDRKWFVPTVEIPPMMDEMGEMRPADPTFQRSLNAVIRNFMVQQHKDFGTRGRVKLATKEILHHGSAVIEMCHEQMYKYRGGTKPMHLKAPVPKVYSMWNSFPDPSPSVQGTEVFYTGSMLVREYVKLQDALENPAWINKEKLQHVYNEKKLHEHIEILHFFGDVFLKRYDGNIIFPNRKTTVTREVFLASEVYKTDYSPIIYTGYERDDVRDPYYTSPIEKRAPMAKFATHMANKTMDSVDLKVKPPVTYDSLDNSLRGKGPQIYPGARIGTRGGAEIKVLDVGDPAVGLAAMQFAKQSLQEGTSVDANRKGVSPGTEQTATEIIKNEQRSEVRQVEFMSAFENELLLPMLIMQHDLNLVEMSKYPFFNDEPTAPDFMFMTSQDLPKSVIFEVTGSRSILGEQERVNRFAQTAALAAGNQMLAMATNWPEVAKQLWDDSMQKDPARFVKESEDPMLGQMQQQMQEFQAQAQEQMQALQQEIQKAQEALQKEQDARRKAEANGEQSNIQLREKDLEIERIKLRIATLQEELRLTNETFQAERQLQAKEEKVKAAAEKSAEPKKEEPKQQAAPQNIYVVSGGEKKAVEIKRDANGRVSGATVKPAEGEE